MTTKSSILCQAAKHRLLTAQEEAVVIAKAKAGDAEAADLLARANVRLLIKLAHRWHGRARRSSLTLDDILSAAAVAVPIAIRRYRPDGGARFATVLMWQVRAELNVHARNLQSSMPLHPEAQRLRKRLRAEVAASREKGEALRLDAAAKKLGATKETVHALLHAPDEPMSLETPLRSESKTTLGETLGNDAPTPLDALERKRLRETLERVLASLAPHEQAAVARLYFDDADAAEVVTELNGGCPQLASKPKLNDTLRTALRKLRKLLQHHPAIDR